MKKLNRTETADFLGVSTETLRRWEKQRKGPRFYRLSDKVMYYLESDLLEWLDEKCIEPANAYSVHNTTSEGARPA